VATNMLKTRTMVSMVQTDTIRMVFLLIIAAIGRCYSRDFAERSPLMRVVDGCGDAEIYGLTAAIEVAVVIIGSLLATGRDARSTRFAAEPR
jgi:hypothetical protein